MQRLRTSDWLAVTCVSLAICPLSARLSADTWTGRTSWSCRLPKGVAGADLRDRLALGERREDILAGLHRAIVLRAMSILSRSGGVRDEFTFTGGVANNGAAVEALTGACRRGRGSGRTSARRSRRGA